MTNDTTAPDLIERLRYPINGMRPTLTDGRAAANALEAAQARIAELEGALDRIATPEAFFVATSHVDPEAFARMWFAKLIREGSSIQDANTLTEAEVRKRYLPARAALEGKG